MGGLSKGQEHILLSYTRIITLYELKKKIFLLIIKLYNYVQLVFSLCFYLSQ